MKGLVLGKKTLARAIVQNTNMLVRDASELAGILLQELRQDIISGKLKLHGIGSFSVVKRRSRSGVNPKTKRPYQAPERLAIKFKASPLLISELNPAPQAERSRRVRRA
jgi:DNA-binding protein HU-beta